MKLSEAILKGAEGRKQDFTGRLFGKGALETCPVCTLGAAMVGLWGVEELKKRRTTMSDSVLLQSLYTAFPVLHEVAYMDGYRVVLGPAIIRKNDKYHRSFAELAAWVAIYEGGDDETE